MIGQILNGFAIVRSLGAGGMGEVFLARAPTGEQRAIKIVRSDRGPAADAAGRFRREVLALKKLAHPGIVRILDAGALPSGEMYLAMEYVAGQDLQAAVTHHGPFAVVDGLRILRAIAGALAYAHGAGIVHRDLKPANILLPSGDPGGAKIIDYGLAKIVADEGLTRLTADHQVLGSPQYWAPEQSSTAAVGPEADIYAFGGLAYFALTGVAIFRSRPAIAMVFAHVHETPDTLAQRCPNVAFPPGLDELVAGCVAKKPSHRLTAEDVVAELDRLLAGTPDSTARAGRPPELFSEVNSSDTQQAVATQIRQIVVELALQMGRPLDDIDAMQNQVSDLEIELAMLDSDGATLDPERAGRFRAVAATIAEIHRQLATSYRDLADAVLEDRPRAPPDLAMLYEELDALFEQYRST